jgi:iron(III) transport system ATP-binding protein
VAAGPVKAAVRPEAWLIHRGERPHGAAVAGKLLKAAYLGSFFEYTFETVLGNIFVVSPDLTHVLEPGVEVGLALADHGVSVVRAD